MAARSNNTVVIELLDSSDDEEDQAKKPAASSQYFRRPRKPGDCPICYCEYTNKDGVLLSDCGHKFCQDCFAQYVQTKAKDREVLPTQLVCPHHDDKDGKCGQALAQQDIMACLKTDEDRDRYLRLSLSRTVDQQDNMGCCPTAGCSFLFEWDSENRKLDCPLCHQTYCLVCQTGPWHAGVRCEQFQQQQKQEGNATASGGSDGDTEFQNFAAQRKLKQCPKCKFWVEKSSGCNAMHCRCNLVFCYQCGGCLKGTAQKNGFEECKCGSESLLQAHEGGPNHNLLAGQRRGPGMNVAMGMGLPLVPGLQPPPIFGAGPPPPPHVGFAANPFGGPAQQPQEQTSSKEPIIGSLPMVLYNESDQYAETQSRFVLTL